MEPVIPGEPFRLRDS